MIPKHFIYTEARSGSNYLVNLFNQHPQLANYGEVLGDWTKPHQIYRMLSLNGKPNHSYLNFIYSNKLFFYLAQIYYALQNIQQQKSIKFKQYKQVKSLGIKDFHYNLWDYGLLDFFQKNQDILIIYLYRENLLKQHISLEMMRKTKVVSSQNLENCQQKPEDIKKRKLYIDTDEIMEILQIAEDFVQQKEELLSNLPDSRILRISYEQLFSSPESQNSFRDQAFQFLGVEQIKIESDHRKISSNNLVDIVENYQEVYDALVNTKFAKYLD